MSEWTAGYVAEVGYTYGYYNELNPARIKLAFLNAGLAFPEVATACELGFGQGLSVNIHAAASVTQWHGTDFNPSQAAFARELATISGAELHLLDDAFSEFAKRADIPDFDYIALHGIWSWISDENRSVIVDFLRSKLKPGGVLYISYNTMPGWGPFAPMRRLLNEHTMVLGAPGASIAKRIDGALEFADRMLATNPNYCNVNHSIAGRVNKMKEQDRRYLAHEFFNKDWHPMDFSTMAHWLEPAKLSYAGSAYYLDQVDVLNLTDAQQAFLREIPDSNFRESVRDFMVNQFFRRDYWVKGARKLSPLARAECIQQQRLILRTHREDIVLKATGSLGEATLNPEIYNPILDCLSDYKIKTIAQIQQVVEPKGIELGKLYQAIMVLTGVNHLSPVQSDAVIAKAKKFTDKLNSHLIEMSRSSEEISFLASPVTGGAVPATRFQLMFLSALSKGRKTPEDWAGFALETLAIQGQKLQKDGKVFESDVDAKAELLSRAQAFKDKNLPLFRILQVL